MHGPVDRGQDDGSGKWEVYTETGREHSGLDVVDWAQRGFALGAGEVLVTSIDREGMPNGYDTGLIAAVADVVEVPVIASGGYGRPGDLLAAIGAGADALAVADALHYGWATLAELRGEMWAIP
jgi:imidazole glycerol-phosphate synthase subunit HisF